MRLSEFATDLRRLDEALTPPDDDDIFRRLMSLVKYNQGDFKSPAEKNFLFRAMGARPGDTAAEFNKTDRYVFGERGGSVRNIVWTITCDSQGVTRVLRDSARGVETRWARDAQHIEAMAQRVSQERERKNSQAQAVVNDTIRIRRDQAQEYRGQIRPSLVARRGEASEGVALVSDTMDRSTPESREVRQKILDRLQTSLSNIDGDIQRLDLFYDRVDEILKGDDPAGLSALASVAGDYWVPWTTESGLIAEPFQRLYQAWVGQGQWWPQPQSTRQASPPEAKISPAKPTRVAGEFLGQVGGRLPPTEVTVEDVKVVSGPYGPGYGHVMVDHQGNTLMWWTNREVFPRGSVARITGTIKDHKSFNGQNQTVLKLVKSA